MKIERLFEDLNKKIKSYNPNYDVTLLKKAYDLAFSAHEGQTRVSGEPFIIHPLMVAYILAELKLDLNSIIVAVLHDVVEDTSYSISEISEQFGSEIAALVEGLTKLDKIPFSTKEEQQAENLRKLFLAMAKDLRVIVIKLADRLHNMRTLKSLPEEKQREKSLETMEVYAPLAHRLGMSKIKWEFEDASLRYLDPIAYQEISENISHKRRERESYIERIKSILTQKLSALEIEHHMEGRAKHFYSIYRKMYSQNINIDQIYDLLAVRVIVDSISDCYRVLGLVHEIFKPIPGRFKDYIAMPKNNMYQSLHTTLIGPSGAPFEVQIRTWEMHNVAEVGIAAHWRYKEGGKALSDDKKFEWIRQILDSYQTSSDAGDFISSLKIDLFEDEVFVFSPKGDLKNLPVGSTPLDFAYAIHSAIGNKTMGAKVNGKIVQLEYKLKNGDIIEIITSSAVRGPSRDWLKIVKTNQAKKKIHEWFKRENREENIARGKSSLEKELKHASIDTSIVKNKDWQQLAMRKYSAHSIDDVYAMLGYGGLPITKLITQIKDFYIKNMPQEDLTDKKPIPEVAPPRQTKNASGIIVSGLDNCLVKLSRCCNPVPGDDIIGYITRGRGVSIHRRDCINASKIEGEATDHGERFVEVWWGDSIKTTFTAAIKIMTNTSNTLVMHVNEVLLALKIPIVSMDARFGRDNKGVLNITIEVPSKELLEKMIKKLWKIPGITAVQRDTH